MAPPNPNLSLLPLTHLLRLLRTERGLSLSELARKSGMAKGALSAWETGPRTPSGHNLESVLDTLNVREGEKALILAVATPSHACPRRLNSR